jgi:hypothetical protein
MGSMAVRGYEGSQNHSLNHHITLIFHENLLSLDILKKFLSIALEALHVSNETLILIKQEQCLFLHKIRRNPLGLVNNKNTKAKLKLTLFPCLSKHHDVKMYWGSGGIVTRIFNLVTR